MTGRPSEQLSAIVGSIIGAILLLLGEFTDVEVSTAASGAIVVLVAWIAYAVTAFIAARQRDGELTSERDGSVSGT